MVWHTMPLSWARWLLHNLTFYGNNYLTIISCLSSNNSGNRTRNKVQGINERMGRYQEMLKNTFLTLHGHTQKNGAA
jgi:hypothetical protein